MKIMRMLKRLLPWNWRNNLPVRRGERDEIDVFGFFNPMNRVFEDFFSGARLFPVVSMSENVNEFTIEASLPHMTRKDINLSILDGVLTIHGECRSEQENRRTGTYSFQRSVSFVHKTIPLPDGIDTDRIKASFKRGVLRVILPKTAEARERVRRIPVTVEA
jgi:HSP20 family protein